MHINKSSVNISYCAIIVNLEALSMLNDSQASWQCHLWGRGPDWATVCGDPCLPASWSHPGEQSPLCAELVRNRYHCGYEFIKGECETPLPSPPTPRAEIDSWISLVRRIKVCHSFKECNLGLFFNPWQETREIFLGLKGRVSFGAFRSSQRTGILVFQEWDGYYLGPAGVSPNPWGASTLST